MGAVLLLVAGCASRGPVVAPVLPASDSASSLELTQIPFYPQSRYYCGPASLAMVLNDAGVAVTPSETGERVYIPDRQGSLQTEMVAATRHYRRMPYVIDGELGALLAELRAGRPVLVFQNLGVSWLPVWHYAVVIGYDAARDEIILRSGTERRKVAPADLFMRTWGRTGNWAMVVLEPAELPARPDATRFVAAADAMAAVDPGLSERWLSEAAGRWPASALVHFALGNALYADDQSGEALAAFRRAVSLDPAHAAARNNIAHILMEQGCFEGALTQIEKAIRSAPEDNPGLLATLRQTRGEIRQARKAGEAAICP